MHVMQWQGTHASGNRQAVAHETQAARTHVRTRARTCARAHADAEQLGTGALQDPAASSTAASARCTLLVARSGPTVEITGSCPTTPLAMQTHRAPVLSVLQLIHLALESLACAAIFSRTRCMAVVRLTSFFACSA